MARAKNVQLRELAESDFRAVMTSPEGRRFVMRLVFGSAGVQRASYNESPLRTAFAEGQRAVGLQVLAEGRMLAPEATLLAQQEFLRLESFIDEEGARAAREAAEADEG